MLLPFAVSPLVLAACGGGGDTAGSPILQVFDDASAAQTEGLSDRLSMLANMRFELAADLPELGGNRAAYVMKPAELPRDRVDRLLSIFGIEGELQAPSVVDGGGYYAGSGDGSGPSMYIGGDALQYWNYSVPVSDSVIDPSCFDTSSIEPVAPPTPVTESSLADAPEDPATSDSTESSDPQSDLESEVESDAATDVVEVICPDEEMPKDIPSDDEAVQMFEDLMIDIGVEVDDLVIDVFSDDFGANVTGYLKIDGVRSPLSWTVSYAGAGRIMWAGGVLGDVEKFARYERIGTQAGLDRLNDMQRAFVDQMVVDPASSTEVGADNGSTGEVVVRIDAVEEELVMLYGVDGSVYLLPGYAFLAVPDGLGYEPRYTVNAIPDDFIQRVAPDQGGSFEEPGTVEPGFESPEVVAPVGDETGGESMDQISSEQANTLLGMSESEATAAAEANGWVVRVAARDGEQFALTMEYNGKRVNLTVDSGVVTYVFVG